ncbi:kinase RLK-Pelle-CrRLK1L-1 family protein [Tanacetum coccineum]
MERRTKKNVVILSQEINPGNQSNINVQDLAEAMLRRLSQAEGLNNVELVGDLNSNSFRLSFNHHLPDFSSSAYIVDSDNELFPHAMRTTHDSSAPQSFPTTADQVPVYGYPSEFYGTFINKIEFFQFVLVSYSHIMAEIQELKHLKIPLRDINLATNNFSKYNFIGKGGFGRVYKGQLLHSTICTTVAVKRLDMNISGQGPREFLIEIVMLASYKHHNLVSLVGFCDEDGEKIIVYKHEVHGSLDKYLASTDVTWDRRLRICLGAARGLEYLQNGVGMGHRVLHRDIKSFNILLDAKWEAKISDFGLCKLGPTNQELTFLVTNAAGTYGYVDPEYVKTGIFTKESDVYSFGVVLFEVLCGRLALISEYHDVRRFLFMLVKLHYDEGKLDEIIIPHQLKEMNQNSVKVFSKIAYQCLMEDRKQRPTMRLIVQELEIALDLQMGCRKLMQTNLRGSVVGGNHWSFVLNANQKLRKITIDQDIWIHSITFMTEDANGSLHSSHQYGGNNGPSRGRFSQINFDVDEEIIGISGTAGRYRGLNLISSLYFITNKKKHGSFGQDYGYGNFSESWDVGLFAGFYGRCGSYLDAIGCCLNR